MKSRINFIKTLAATIFGTAFIGTKTAKAANTEQASKENTFKDLSKKVEELEKNVENSAVSMDPFIGEIIMFAGNFAPRNWALCQGQLLPISDYNALFSILGTTYGGDGRTTFALPDLRGRTPISQGQGPGLSSRPLGQKSGLEYVTPSIASSSSAAGPGRSGNVAVGTTFQSSFNMQPYLVVNYIIALYGAYPSRS